MGVKGLSSFMERNFNWPTKDVRQGNLVIDGSSLCYHLYFNHYQWKLGGEYCEFYCAVRDYLNELKSLGITVYIVMDGIDLDDSKKAAHEKRCHEKFGYMTALSSDSTKNRAIQFSVLPLFAKFVFLDAVRSVAGINWFVADGEADQSIVSLANSLKCPVLGKDSDFFIFDIDGGYIPIGNSNGSLVTLHKPVKYVQASDFDLSPEQRLYLPLILGCDISNGYPFRRLGIDSSAPVHKIISAIKQSLLSEADVGRFGSNQALVLLSQIRAYYTVKPQSFAELSSSQSLAVKNPSIPEWVLDNYKRGIFSGKVLHFILSRDKIWRYSIVVENVFQTNAWIAAEDILLHVIGRVLKERVCSVTITIRNGLKLCGKKAVLTRENHVIYPQLADVEKMSLEDRKEFFFNIFKCNDIISVKIRDELKLAIFVTKFWLNKDPSHGQWLSALILSLQACSRLKPPQRDDRYLLQGDEKLHFIHAFAQWQCILCHAIALNQVLNCPFPGADVTPRLYSSVAIQHFYHNKLELDEEAKQFRSIVLKT